MKTDGRLARCPLKAAEGDALFAVLCGCGQNLRLILRHLRSRLLEIWREILASLAAFLRPKSPQAAAMAV